jgi:phytoene desaturase
MKKVVIVGAGLGGLASAALLAKSGYDVTVIEKNEQPGGRASVYSDKGFTFDMGPSWYLMPDVFERYFSLFNKTPADFYKLIRLDPAYKIFFGKNESVDIHADLEENLRLFESLEENGAKKLLNYLDKSKYQYETSMKYFMYRSYQNMFDISFLKNLPGATQLRVFDNIDSFARRFFKTEKARKILQYNIVFLGGSLKNTPALYAIMAHIDFNLGVWYPDGGIYEIVKGITRLCEDYNVKIRYNDPVTKVEVENGKATAVITENSKYTGDIILINADYHHAETKLLDKQYQTYPQGYWNRATVAPSGFIAYLGVNKKIDTLAHHNLFLDNDWVQHFNQIFDAPQWPENPSYYICAPSKTDKTVAPEGMENLFILVPVAAGLNDSDEIREKYYEKTLDHVEDLIGENIRDHIVTKRIFAHREFTSRYNAFKGTALGLSHTLFQSAWFRPHHQSKKVKNLFYTGGYTHPGIGVPIQLISAEIVTNMIQEKN